MGFKRRCAALLIITGFATGCGSTPLDALQNRTLETWMDARDRSLLVSLNYDAAPDDCPEPKLEVSVDGRAVEESTGGGQTWNFDGARICTRPLFGLGPGEAPAADKESSVVAVEDSSMRIWCEGVGIGTPRTARLVHAAEARPGETLEFEFEPAIEVPTEGFTFSWGETDFRRVVPEPVDANGTRFRVTVPEDVADGDVRLHFGTDLPARVLRKEGFEACAFMVPAPPPISLRVAPAR